MPGCIIGNNNSNIHHNTSNDIITAIKFVKSHNLELSILSTGHSYTGRSYGKYNFSFQINLSKHKYLSISNDYNTVTAETGLISNKFIWPLIHYQLRLFAGGTCHSVGIGGFMGAGHSLSAYQV